MSIQSDINSALGQIGIMASLNPELQEAAKDRSELRKLNRESETLATREATVMDELDKLGIESRADKARLDELGSRMKSGGLTKEEAQELKAFEELYKTKQGKLDVLKAEHKGITQRQGEILTQQYQMSPEAYADDYFKYKYGSPRDYDIEKARRARERASNMSRAKQELRGLREELLARGGDMYDWRGAIHRRGGDMYETRYVPALRAVEEAKQQYVGKMPYTKPDAREAIEEAKRR